MLSKAYEIGKENLLFYLLLLLTICIDQMLCGAEKGSDACLL